MGHAAFQAPLGPKITLTHGTPPQNGVPEVGLIDSHLQRMKRLPNCDWSIFEL